MMGMWKAVRMLRVIILTIGWLVFSYSQTTLVHADEDVNPPAGSPSAPDYLEGKLAAGTYLVLGTFEKKSNAHAFKQRYARFDATVFAIKSKGKTVFRIVVGLVRELVERTPYPHPSQVGQPRVVEQAEVTVAQRRVKGGVKGGLQALAPVRSVGPMQVASVIPCLGGQLGVPEVHAGVGQHGGRIGQRHQGIEMISGRALPVQPVRQDVMPELVYT